jgi:hypothetical protein
MYYSRETLAPAPVGAFVWDAVILPRLAETVRRHDDSRVLSPGRPAVRGFCLGAMSSDVTCITLPVAIPVMVLSQAKLN